MSLFLRLRATASRARTMLGRAGRQSRVAKQHRSQFYQDIWREAANELGATVESLDDELLRITRDGVETKVYRNYTDLDGPVTLRAVGNKPFVHQTLRSLGLPTPDYLVFSLSNLTPAVEFLYRHQICVVKPASGTGAGEGITTGIETRRQLTTAAVTAAGSGPRLVIERQVAGDNLRLLYLDGRLLDAVQRCPPTAVGDGRSSVWSLVQRLNEQRIANGYAVAQVTLKCDLDMQRTLAQQNLSGRSVPAAGQRVVLKTVINDNAAADNVSVLGDVSDDIVEAGRQAAASIGVRLAGVDILTPDLRSNLISVGGVVLEVNTTPGLYIHYHQSGKSVRVAVPILEACLKVTRSVSEGECSERP